MLNLLKCLENTRWICWKVKEQDIGDEIMIPEQKFPLIFSKQNIHVYLQMMLGFKLLHKLNNTKNKQGKIVKWPNFLEHNN